jgi:hypothetical protein
VKLQENNCARRRLARLFVLDLTWRPPATRGIEHAHRDWESSRARPDGGDILRSLKLVYCPQHLAKRLMPRVAVVVEPFAEERCVPLRGP